MMLILDLIYHILSKGADDDATSPLNYPIQIYALWNVVMMTSYLAMIIDYGATSNKRQKGEWQAGHGRASVWGYGVGV